MALPAGRIARLAARRGAERAGRRAEWLAAAFLILRGYRILARRFKASGGEIDLVAKRGDLVVFAEVKARKTYDDAILAVTAQARRRIERASQIYIARHPFLADFGNRYDIIAVCGWRVRRLADAWRPGE